MKNDWAFFSRYRSSTRMSLHPIRARYAGAGERVVELYTCPVAPTIQETGAPSTVFVVSMTLRAGLLLT